MASQEERERERLIATAEMAGQEAFEAGFRRGRRVFYSHEDSSVFYTITDTDGATMVLSRAGEKDRRASFRVLTLLPQ